MAYLILEAFCLTDCSLPLDPLPQNVKSSLHPGLQLTSRWVLGSQRTVAISVWLCLSLEFFQFPSTSCPWDSVCFQRCTSECREVGWIDDGMKTLFLLLQESDNWPRSSCSSSYCEPFLEQTVCWTVVINIPVQGRGLNTRSF